MLNLIIQLIQILVNDDFVDSTDPQLLVDPPHLNMNIALHSEIIPCPSSQEAPASNFRSQEYGLKYFILRHRSYSSDSTYISTDTFDSAHPNRPAQSRNASVQVLENDRAGLCWGGKWDDQAVSARVETLEGGNTFLVMLLPSKPMESVTITLMIGPTVISEPSLFVPAQMNSPRGLALGIELSEYSLQWDSSDWNMPKSLLIIPLDDNILQHNRTVFLNATSSSLDPRYQWSRALHIPIFVHEDDKPGIYLQWLPQKAWKETAELARSVFPEIPIHTPLEATCEHDHKSNVTRRCISGVPESQRASFSLQLAAIPEEVVSVTVFPVTNISSLPIEITYPAPDSFGRVNLMFYPESWDKAQILQVKTTLENDSFVNPTRKPSCLFVFTTTSKDPLFASLHSRGSSELSSIDSILHFSPPAHLTQHLLTPNTTVEPSVLEFGVVDDDRGGLFLFYSQSGSPPIVDYTQLQHTSHPAAPSIPPNPSPVIVPEGNKTVYWIACRAIPTHDVTIAMQITGTASHMQVVATPSHLVFTSGNWKELQSVTINVSYY